ncbi:MAG: TRAP transporter large permease subunit [Tagaea sp.]
MSGQVLGLLMFAPIFLALFLGFPVAFTMAGTALLAACVGALAGYFDLGLLATLPLRTIGLLDGDLLQALPLFVYLGAVLRRTGIAAAMQATLADLAGGRPGGLAVAALAMGALLAPTTGAVGATVLTLAALSLPGMLAAGYDKRVAAGLVCAAGTLGTILPPSIVLILMAESMRGAISEARAFLIARGDADVPILSFTSQDIYAGALVPVGLLLAVYAAYLVWVAMRAPAKCPAGPARRVGARRLFLHLLLPAGALIFMLTGIVRGWFYTVEAASGAAMLVTLYAFARREIGWAAYRDLLREVARIVGMIFLLLMAASVVAMVFRGFGSDLLLHRLLANVPGGALGATAAVMAFAFVFGFFLDAIETVTLIVPIAMPALIALGADVVWLSVLMAVKVQTSFMVPPSGFAVFFLRATAPKEVAPADIHRGVLPYIGLQALVLVLLWGVPDVTHALSGRAISFAAGAVAPADAVPGEIEFGEEPDDAARQEEEDP